MDKPDLTSGPRDYHVMPTYGRTHEPSRACWGGPEPDPGSAAAKDSGAATGIVWVHHEDN